MEFVCLGWALSVCAFAWLLVQREKAHDAERAKLLNRIQKPELAVAQSIAGAPDLTPAFVPFDDDKAFHDYAETRE